MYSKKTSRGILAENFSRVKGRKRSKAIMNYKIVYTFLIIAAVGAFIVVGRSIRNTSAEVAARSPVENSIEIRKTSDDKDSFMPLAADKDAAPDAEDRLISAEKATPRAGIFRRALDQLRRAALA